MLKTKINNRRYLGNKYRLLPFITDVISKECGTFNSFADIFAGTGAVKVFSEQFKVFTTGKSEHLDNTERLFV